MGGQIIEPSAEPYYGDQAGIFVANGIAPQVTTLGNGAAMLQAVTGGDLDAGLANPLQLAVAMTRNIPVQAIAVACIYTKAVADPNFVVAKNSPIKVPKDLIGATLGIGALGDFSQISLWAWLEANGVPRTSVKFVELPVPEIGAALQRNQIQGGFLVEPYKSEALKAGLIRDFADTFAGDRTGSGDGDLVRFNAVAAQESRHCQKAGQGDLRHRRVGQHAQRAGGRDPLDGDEDRSRRAQPLTAPPLCDALRPEVRREHLGVGGPLRRAAEAAVGQRLRRYRLGAVRARLLV